MGMVSICLPLRITPACAGKSSLTSGYIPARGDHPRVCGEKCFSFCYIFWHLGSPPRVRGKAIAAIGLDTINGITPACAGKRATPSARASNCRDHPRVCGEKRTGTPRAAAHSGSPPRVRGKGKRTVASTTESGITPACAGKSAAECIIGGQIRDHPRVCGEKREADSKLLALQGSPPRVRGKEGNQERVCGDVGITPACAGKSGRTGR